MSRRLAEPSSPRPPSATRAVAASGPRTVAARAPAVARAARRAAVPHLGAVAAVALAAALAAAACDGNHAIGIEDDLDAGKCCYSMATGQKVASCGADPACVCAPELCQSGQACKAPRDCPQLGIPCEACADGTTACPSVDCVKGQCKASLHHCPKPSCQQPTDCPLPKACPQCSDGSCGVYTAHCNAGKCEISGPTCPKPDQCGGDGGGSGCAAPAVCQQCPDGSTTCAQARCVDGKCQTFFPPCPDPQMKCKSDGECPKPGAPCQPCPDGSSACPKAWCDNGVCKASFPSCPPGCTSDGQCPAPKVCKACPDGQQVCAKGACLKGTCAVVWPDCPAPGACHQPPAASVTCGNKTCGGKTSVCCRNQPFGDGTCVAPTDKCATQSYCCSRASDCAKGELCCEVSGAGSTCATAAECQAKNGRRMCVDAGDCNQGESCCGVGPSPSFFCGTVCPISRRDAKTGIHYLDDAELGRVHDELMRFRLSTWRYKTDDPATPEHLGFIIDDVLPSPSVAPGGRTVDLYGYTSMAVAALQAQERRVAELEAEVRALRRLVGRRAARRHAGAARIE